ncbi:MAG: amidoligase family protein [Bacteroidales bacterium]|jgi:hypothetical protein|nr:amidoligase family protein [Bacteroidales bacterium]
MRSKVNQVFDVLKSNESKESKVTKLIELGINENEVHELFALYETEDDVLYTIGVEIECFGLNKTRFNELCVAKGIDIQTESYNHDTKPHFKVVCDSSIQGEAAIECVTPVLRNKAGFDNLEKVCDALNEAGAKVNKSTGLHVHVGLQNVDFETYKNCFINYHYLEPAIDKFMANSRRGNNNAYCRSLINRGIDINRIINAQNMQEIEDVFVSDRYYKLNPVSYSRHNTLEFRQHQGTTDYKKIYKWVMLLTSFVAWSKKHRLTSHITSIDAIPAGIIDKKFKNYYNKRAAELNGVA